MDRESSEEGVVVIDQGRRLIEELNLERRCRLCLGRVLNTQHREREEPLVRGCRVSEGHCDLKDIGTSDLASEWAGLETLHPGAGFEGINDGNVELWWENDADNISVDEWSGRLHTELILGVASHHTHGGCDCRLQDLVGLGHLNGHLVLLVLYHVPSEVVGVDLETLGSKQRSRILEAADLDHQSAFLRAVEIGTRKAILYCDTGRIELAGRGRGEVGAGVQAARRGQRGKLDLRRQVNDNQASAQDEVAVLDSECVCADLVGHHAIGSHRRASQGRTRRFE